MQPEEDTRTTIAGAVCAVVAALLVVGAILSRCDGDALWLGTLALFVGALAVMLLCSDGIG